MGKGLKVAGIVFLSAFLAACQTTQGLSIGSEQEAMDIAIGKQIDEALKRVSDQPRWASSLDDRASFASFNTDKVNVSYQGSAEDLMRAVAASRGESFKVTGPKPHIPIFVFVEVVDLPFDDFLRDLSKQFGQRADIVRTDEGFEIRYR